MKVELGINTGFALNRFTTPEEWIPLVSERLGVRLVQFTADLLNPSLPNPIIESQISKINTLKKNYDIKIHSTFTSAFTRVNHLSHPDPELRNYWRKWFFKFVEISSALDAESMGSHFGIFTVRDNQDLNVKRIRFRQNVEAWQDIAQYAKQKGLQYLSWEPMSISREMGETLEEARRIHEEVNRGIALPMKMCLDVDHGDVSSKNPRDTDPYAWISEFAKETCYVHLKQSSVDKGGHWPFTSERNRNGKIEAERIIDAFRRAGTNHLTLFLELSFREREPYESRVVDDLIASVNYWKPYTSG